LLNVRKPAANRTDWFTKIGKPTAQDEAGDVKIFFGRVENGCACWAENRRAPQENSFQYTDEEIRKLEDPNIKACFIVNPGNPTGVSW
jgi:hypothetical protein